MGSITERRVQSAHTPRSLALFSVPFPRSSSSLLSSTPPYTHPLTVIPSFSRTCTRTQCCLFLFLRCLSVCSTLMHLLAYRYNCRAIIKAGLSSLPLLPPSPYLPPIQPPFSLLPSSLPSLFIPLFLSFSISRPFLDPDSQCISQPFNLCPYSILFAITDPKCTDFEGKSRRINFCARISIGTCSWRAEDDRGWTVEVCYLWIRRNTRCYSDIKGFFLWWNTSRDKRIRLKWSWTRSIVNVVDKYFYKF